MLVVPIRTSYVLRPFNGCLSFSLFFFFQAEDGIRDLVRSRGLGDVYKRQVLGQRPGTLQIGQPAVGELMGLAVPDGHVQQLLLHQHLGCLLYTSDAADERSSVDLGGRRIIKKKTYKQ